MKKIIPKFPYSRFDILKLSYLNKLKLIMYDKIVCFNIYKNSNFKNITIIYVNIKISVKF